MLRRNRKLLAGKSEVELELVELENAVASLGSMIGTPEEMQQLVLLHKQAVELEEKCEGEQVARIEKLLSDIQILADTEEMIPSREYLAMDWEDNPGVTISDKINEIFDALALRVEDEVRYWKEDPENEFSIVSMTDRWKKENMLELFGKGGPMPRTVMGISVRVEALRILGDLEKLIKVYRGQRLSEVGEDGEGALERAKNDQTHIVSKLKDRKDAGETNLENFEEFYDTYFRYVNLTQFVNQYFYGAIFFPALDNLKNAALNWLAKLNPWIRGKMLKKAADKASKEFMRAVMAGNKYNAYNYALEYATANAFTPMGLLESKMLPPGGKVVPPLDLAALNQGKVFNTVNWRRLKTEMVISGRFMTKTEWYAKVWPVIFENYSPTLSKSLERLTGQMALDFSKRGVEMWSDDVTNKLLANNPVDDIFKLGIVASDPIDVGAVLTGLATNVGTVARNAATSFALNPVLVEAQEAGGESITDSLERRIQAFLSQRIEERKEEVFEVVKESWDNKVEDLTDRAQNTHEVVSVQDIADELQRVMDANSGLMYSRIEEIAEEEIEKGDWDEFIDEESSPDEELGQGWYGECVGIYYGIFAAQDITHARASLGRLIGMQGTAPVPTVGGYDLEKSLDGLIVSAQTWLEGLEGDE